MLQTQLQLKKATHAATATSRKPDMGSPAVSSKKPSLPPVKDFKKSKRDSDNNAEDNKYFPPSMVRASATTFTVAL